jgi:hypothetical protein
LFRLLNLLTYANRLPESTAVGQQFVASDQHWQFDLSDRWHRGSFQQLQENASRSLAGFVVVGVRIGVVWHQNISAVDQPIGHHGVQVERNHQRDVADNFPNLTERSTFRITFGLSRHRTMETQINSVNGIGGAHGFGQLTDQAVQVRRADRSAGDSGRCHRRNHLNSSVLIKCVNRPGHFSPGPSIRRQHFVAKIDAKILV